MKIEQLSIGLPLPVPHSEKKLSSAAVNGLSSSIGMQYLQDLCYLLLQRADCVPYNMQLTT